MNQNLTNKNLKNLEKYIDNKLIKENINIYFNTKNSDGTLYINNIKKNTIFISGCRMNIKNQYSFYYFVTNNSWNPQLSKTGSITDLKLKKYKQIFNFYENYNYNKNGSIYILINNTNGWFMNHCKIKYHSNNNNYISMITNLVNKIRKYSNRKIKIRIHPYDKTNFKEKVKDYIRINKNIELDTDKIDFKDIYCVFIQNTKFILDFVNYGIPIFNLNFFKCNYFPEIQIKDISLIEKLNEIILPNRIDFFKKFYYHIILNQDNLLFESVKKFYL